MTTRIPTDKFITVLEPDPTRAAMRAMAPGVLAWLGQFYCNAGFDLRSWRTTISAAFEYDTDLTNDKDERSHVPLNLWVRVLTDLSQLDRVGARLKSGGYRLDEREAPKFSPVFEVGLVDNGFGSVDAVLQLTLRPELDVADLLNIANDEGDLVARELCNWVYRSLVAEFGDDRGDEKWSALLERLEQTAPAPV